MKKAEKVALAMCNTILLYMVIFSCMGFTLIFGNIPEALAKEKNSMNVAISADKITPIKVGSAIPDGPLLDMDNKATTLHAVLQNKPAVLIIYRGSW